MSHLFHLSVRGDGVAAAHFLDRSCVLGWPWLGCDFGRREHLALVLHHHHPRSSASFFPLSSTVSADGACNLFILQLLLTSYRLRLPHSPLFITDAQHLHEVQLHLLLAGKKMTNSPVCVCVGIMWCMMDKAFLFLGTERVCQHSRSGFWMKPLCLWRRLLLQGPSGWCFYTQFL